MPTTTITALRGRDCKNSKSLLFDSLLTEDDFLNPMKVCIAFVLL